MKFIKVFIYLFFCITLIGCASTANEKHDHEHDHEHEQLSPEKISELEALEKNILKELDFGECKKENIKDTESIEVCNYEKDFNEKDLKKQFPNLKNFNIVDGYQLNKINIVLDEATNKNLEMITNWSDFNRFSFELIKDKTNVINLIFVPQEFLIEEPMKIKEKNFNGTNYKLIYIPNEDGYEGIIKDTLINNKKFYIAFNNYNTKDNKVFLEEIEFLELIEKDIVKNL